MTEPSEVAGSASGPVRYNDWRQVELPPLAEFRPELPVSVIVPYYAQREELGRTLAALEGQSYPRELFEVVVVDDGSPEPLTEVGSALLDRAPFEVRVVRQEDLGFGPARARNTGVRAAAHEVLLFLDADLLPEAGWLSAHARWHHAAPDVLTLGAWTQVSVDGVDAEAIRDRPGTLKDLFAGRRVDRARFESYWVESDGLTSGRDDLFRALASENFGVRRGFFDLVGGFDESFTAWGGEDAEFGYRAFTRGGLFAPVWDGCAWHQGRGEARTEGEGSESGIGEGKLAHLIPHWCFRISRAGRIYTVPWFVVTIRGGALPAEDLLGTVERVLAHSGLDLVVRLELPEWHPGREWLEGHLGPDRRVRVAPSLPALEEFPASPFQVTLPAGQPLEFDVVRRLRTALGTGVLAWCVFPDGSRASITRSWALHRALRTPWKPADFGEVVRIPPAKLAPAWVPANRPKAAPAGGPLRRVWERIGGELRRVDGPRAAWRFVRWFGGAVLRKVAPRFRSAFGIPVVAAGAPTGVVTPVSAPGSESPLGVEIAALGPRSGKVFGASRRVARTLAGQHVDVVLADTAAEAAGVEAPVVVLEDSPPQLSVPAFDPWVHNPIGCAGWTERRGVGALGPLDRLPAGLEADREVRADDRPALRRLRYLEDVAAFHRDPVARAGELVRLAATGVVVHLADGDRGLERYLGAELFDLMTSEIRELGDEDLEELGVRQRRAALREHSLGSRARQVAGRVLADPPWLPLVSVVVATRRPGFVGRVLATVRQQTYPRLELILGLHGEGFGEVGSAAAGPSAPVTVLRLDAGLPLGSVLNAAAREARGTLITKMDDDDVYGSEHIWDLVLAHEYSRAPLVGKASEFVYVSVSNRTICARWAPSNGSAPRISRAPVR